MSTFNQAIRFAVSQAKDELDAAVNTLGFAEQAVAITRAEGNEAAITAAELVLVGARNNLLTKSNDYEDAVKALQNALATWVAGSAENEVARLAGDRAITLFPARLETRFVGDKLYVRIYPDEVSINTLEPGLTVEERKAGENYYNRVRKLGINENLLASAELEQWKILVSRFDRHRAAYILKALTPNNGAGFKDGRYNHDLDTNPSSVIDFPTDVVSIPDNWMRSANAVLPDRWHLYLYRNGAVVQEAATTAVREPLATTLDPSAHELRFDDVGTRGFQTDRALKWLVDFQEAKLAGMAVEISAPNLNEGFDRIIAVGVKSSFSLAQSAAFMGDLFDAHHYDRGIAIIGEGTPTNNIEGRPSAYPPSDANAGEESFQIERVPPPPRKRDDFAEELSGEELRNSDGERLALALGVGRTVMTNVTGAQGLGLDAARAMNTVLWPATLGYFAETMMDPVFSGTGQYDKISEVRGFFQDWVHGSGFAPSLRIGSVPYGVLPATSLGRWQTRDSDIHSAPAFVRDFLLNLMPIWRTASEGVPRVRANTTSGPPSDINRDLLEALSLDGRTHSVWAREALPSEINTNLFWFLGKDFNAPLSAISKAWGKAAARIGKPQWQPRVGNVGFADQSNLFSGSFVEREGGETASSYLLRIINAATPTGLDALRDDFPGVQTPDALLYLLVRHSLLVQVALEAWRIMKINPPVGAPHWVERMLWGIYKSLGNETTVWNFIDAAPSRRAELLGASSEAGAVVSKMHDLRTLNPRELERYMLYTLDVCSHRLDAWVSAFAAARIGGYSRPPVQDEQGQGAYYQPMAYMGGYAVVENLRRKTRQSAGIEGRQAERDDVAGGYLHTPSLGHAHAAAVLRNAYLSNRNSDAQQYAIDLSSSRARKARQVLDEMREGQPLGAIFGYRFERNLHENGLNQYKQALRQRYPLVIGKSESPNDDPTLERGARHVVDGLRAYRAFDAGAFPFGAADLPPSNSAAESKLRESLLRLQDDVDAVADLVTAESVYQITKGNTYRTASTLDSLANGTMPPDPEFIQIPRGGTGITHRIVIAFKEGEATLPGWPAVATNRSMAEPALERWLAALLGNPAEIGFAIKNGDTVVRHATVFELGLRPLDLLAVVGPMLDDPSGGRDFFKPYAFEALGRTQAEAASFTLDLSDAGTAPAGSPPMRPLSSMLEVLRSAISVLGAGRPLGRVDLVAAEQATGLEPPANPGEEPGNFADNAEEDSFEAAGIHYTKVVGDWNSFIVNDLNDHIEVLQGAPSAAQRDAARGVLRRVTATLLEPAFPWNDMSNDQLRDLAIDLRNRAQARLNSVSIPGSATVESYSEAIRVLFGDTFITLPAFDVPNAAAIEHALVDSSLLAGDPHGPLRLLQQVGRVREPTGRVLRLGTYRRAFRGAPDVPKVLQFPVQTDAKWVGSSKAGPVAGGTTSIIVLDGGLPLTTGGRWQGVLVDEWVDVIPNAVEQTGVAFHYDNPNAEAPNLILAAVPPRDAANWSIDDLTAIINETMDLAKIRAVHHDQLPSVSRIFPAIFLAEGDTKLTVTSPVRRSRVRAAPVVTEG